MSTFGQIVMAVLSLGALGGCLWLCFIAIQIHDEERRAGKQ